MIAIVGTLEKRAAADRQAADDASKAASEPSRAIRVRDDGRASRDSGRRSDEAAGGTSVGPDYRAVGRAATRCCIPSNRRTGRAPGRGLLGVVVGIAGPYWWCGA